MSSAEYNRPIVERFFEVLDALLAMNKIKSIRSFCDTNLFQAFWLIPLMEYGVNAKWLLTGKGKTFE